MTLFIILGNTLIIASTAVPPPGGLRLQLYMASKIELRPPGILKTLVVTLMAHFQQGRGSKYEQ